MLEAVADLPRLVSTSAGLGVGQGDECRQEVGHVASVALLEEDAPD